MTAARLTQRADVLAVASGGGHWVQLMRIAPGLDGLSVSFATVQPAYRADVGDAPFHVIRDATRWDRWGLIVLSFQLMRILWIERPRVVVTTGAAPGLMAIMLARGLGSRTVWIDSIANVDELSMSGRTARRMAHLCLSQWPHVAEREGIRYEGAVL